MSFIYGGADTADLPGVIATLKGWPSAGGITVQNSAIPGGNGRVFGGSTRERTVFTFDVIIEGATPAEVGQRRDEFLGLVDPSRDPRSLQLDADPDWVWEDVLLAQEIEWDRMTWDRQLGFRLRADIVLETQRAAGAVEAAPQSHSGTGSVSFTVQAGNTSSHPRIRFEGGGDITIEINNYSLELAGVPAGSIGELDWSTYNFQLLNSSGDRIGSLVNHMSHYERPTLYPGDEVVATATSSAGGLSLTVFPNSRRI